MSLSETAAASNLAVVDSHLVIGTLYRYVSSRIGNGQATTWQRLCWRIDSGFFNANTSVQ